MKRELDVKLVNFKIDKFAGRSEKWDESNSGFLLGLSSPEMQYYL